MSGPTPGPWKVGRFKKVDRQMGTFYVTSPTLPYVASTVGGLDPAEEQANAHMLAAAPELYDALENAEEILKDMFAPCEDGCECILHEVAAAIEKARGAA